MATPLAKIGILSIGDMGMGIAKLLTAHRFSVATNGSGRRLATCPSKLPQFRQSGFCPTCPADSYGSANRTTSNDTIERARNAQVELLTSDVDLVRACPVILSVVPPRDAVATAQRSRPRHFHHPSHHPSPAPSPRNTPTLVAGHRQLDIGT